MQYYIITHNQEIKLRNSENPTHYFTPLRSKLVAVQLARLRVRIVRMSFLWNSFQYTLRGSINYDSCLYLELQLLIYLFTFNFETSLPTLSSEKLSKNRYCMTLLRERKVLCLTKNIVRHKNSATQVLILWKHNEVAQLFINNSFSYFDRSS